LHESPATAGCLREPDPINVTSVALAAIRVGIDVAPASLSCVLSIANRLRRFRKRGTARLRGLPDLERLVAQGLQLGEGTHISAGTYIDGLHPWLITIGDYATLGPYAAIITHDASLAQHTGQTRLGRVVIGNRAYIGVGAILLPGTTVGADSVVGAGAVVHGEVPPSSLVLGNPAAVSPIKGVVAWQRASAKRAPNWPHEGWTIDSGITEERKRAQRDALADGASGYVPAGPPAGSPYAIANRDKSSAST
jgi:acetyltransferase-like isoleucine patch superfamily enzyme